MKKEEQPTEHYLYSRTQDFKLLLPVQCWLLCKLLQIPPGKLLIEFMRNLGREYDSINEYCKNSAMDYFLECDYGQDHYTQEDIQQMFRELDAIAALWPGMGNSKHLEKHIQLRDKYHVLWEKKWTDKLSQQK